MFKKANLLFLYTETPLHPGVGASVGTVDLPIQRERHTQFPIIQASGVKGALRELAYHIFKLSKGDRNDKIDVVFGPGETERASEHGGALSLTDARLLLFPVRSVRGVFTWITSPGVIARFKRDLELLEIIDKGLDEGIGKALEELKGIQLPDLDSRARQASTPPESGVVLENNENKRILLEDFCFEVVEDGRDRVGKLAKWLSEHAMAEELKDWSDKLERDLVLLSDDDFREFTLFATEVITRIKLGESGTVETGPWDEEHLPSETLLYSLALATDPKAPKDKLKEGVPRDASEVLNFLLDEIINKAKIIQLGGDESVGKGVARIYPLRIKGGAEDE